VTRKRNPGPEIDVDDDGLPAEHPVKIQWRAWKKAQARDLEDIEAAFRVSPAIRGMQGSQARMAIKSGELSDTQRGPLRVTFFGEDGPHGHDTMKDDRGIAERVRESMSPPFVPMTDEDVMAWTTTEAFERGSKLTAFVQAENTLRWFASKAGRSTWAQKEIDRANDLGTRDQTVNARNKPYDGEAMDAAIDVLHAAIGELPVPNPRRKAFVRNPPWVTSTLAKHYEILDDQVPSVWLPQLAAVTSKRNRVIADLVEYGCGAYGCVLATNDPKVVLKVTTDDTEAEFAAQLASELVAPICVDYRMVVRLSGHHQGRRIHLLWREAAEHVGGLRAELGDTADQEVGDQHRSAQEAYDAVMRELEPQVIRQKIGVWLAACERMARSSVAEIRPLGRGLVEVYAEQHVLFGDIHGGNLGLVRQSDGGRSSDAWVITDPGNVAVINDPAIWG